jgi:hypothetical protein
MLPSHDLNCGSIDVHPLIERRIGGEEVQGLRRSLIPLKVTEHSIDLGARTCNPQVVLAELSLQALLFKDPI